MIEDETITEDSAIDEVLGENPRSEQLWLMRAALEERRSALRRDREQASGDVERAHLASKIRTLTRQIKALRQEEGITAFVETSVRVTLTQAALEDLE
jgi:hypothetical protein